MILGRLAAPLAWLGLLGWLAWQLKDSLEDEGAGQAEGQTAGYYLSEARLTEYGEDGSVRLRLSAVRASQAESGGRVEFSNLALDFMEGAVGPWSLNADRGWAWPDLERVELEGNVVMQSKRAQLVQPATIRAPQLTVLVGPKLAITDAPVRIDFGRHELEAIGLQADLQNETLKLEREINGRFIR